MDPFERARQKVAPQVRDRRLTIILNGTKAPVGKDWAGAGANYSINEPALAGYLAEGHCYGVLTGHGLAVVDIDDIQRMKALGIIDQLPETFTIKTGRGGSHFYYLCDIKQRVVLEDLELKDSDGDPAHLGEIQAEGQQVVGPNSKHPNGNRYEILNDVPITRISKVELLEIFKGKVAIGDEEQPKKPTEARRRKSSGGSSLGDDIPIDQVAWPKGTIKRHGAEIIGAHPLHGSTHGDNFHINTAKNCWICRRHNKPKKGRSGGGGGGPLEWLAVEAGLIRCEDARPGCLDKTLLRLVIKIAKDRGFHISDRPVSDGSRLRRAYGTTQSHASRLVPA